MEPLHEGEIDSLAQLEERIRKAAALVAQLRREKDAARKDKEAALAEREGALREAGEARAQVARLSQELDTLRGERLQVRTRIEKLLGQVDLLNAG